MSRPVDSRYINNYALNILALKYDKILELIVNDLASKCIGGEKCKLSFTSGTIIIKIK